MRVGEYGLINNFKLGVCTNLGHLLKNLITSGVMPEENFCGWTRVGTAYSTKIFFFLTECKVGKRRKSGEVVDFVVNVMDVTQGQRDINLHVISKIVIEWIQKWHAVVCCCRVASLSSGVCVLACVCDTERECALYARVCVYLSVKTSSVAAGVKVAEAVNSTHSLILSHFLSHSFIFLFL